MQPSRKITRTISFFSYMIWGLIASSGVAIGLIAGFETMLCYLLLFVAFMLLDNEYDWRAEEYNKRHP
jgi:hypothetical protein